MRTVVARDELAGSAVDVAPGLLNALLVTPECVVRIIEVEAYGGAEDTASHAAAGRTRRNATMFGPPGGLYVYFIYGVYHCANVTCGPEGRASAVLLRAGEVVDGHPFVAARRPRSSTDQWCAGPGRLCLAIGLSAAHDGTDLCDPRSPLRLERDNVVPPERPLAGPRIGLGRRAAPDRDRPWRFGVPGATGLSKPFPSSSNATGPKVHLGEIDHAGPEHRLR
jgi:DNA-3-methyladenine glycosylase